MPKSRPPLYPSQEKIKRAKHKFAYLKAGINRYIQAEPHSLRFKRHADFLYVITHLDKDLPGDFAFEVVEAVGHLRSALDKMIVALVRKNGRGVSGVGFPFGGMSNGKPNPFPDRRIKERVKKKLTPEQWAIIEAQRPYPGGNDTLWAVNEIANTDKHREELVEIVTGQAHSIGVGAAPGIGTYFEELRIAPSDCDFVLDDKERESVLVAVRDGGFNQEINCRITPSIVFGKIMPVEGKNVLVTLNQQIRLVESIISEFRRRFF